MAKKKCYLFVGNPGTGKSTIMNGLAGKAVFKAEPSFSGSGVTFQFDIAEVPGVGLLMDTPGLADVEMKKKASEAITSALKQNGFYRVFFVITLQSGRIHAADKATMKLILESAPITDYSVIVNRVPQEWFGEFSSNKENLTKWLTLLNAGLPVASANVHWMMENSALADKKNVAYTAPSDAITFIRTAPGMVIKSHDVEAVKADELEKLEEKMLAQERAFEEEKDAWRKEMEKQKIATQRAVERAQKQADRAMQEMMEQLEQMEQEQHEREERIREEAREEAAARDEESQQRIAEMQAASRAAQEAAKRMQADLDAATAKKDEGGGFLPILGRVALGITTLGLSEGAIALSKC